eukprot:7656927-Pyramimonas_sp.AAC.2
MKCRGAPSAVKSATCEPDDSGNLMPGLLCQSLGRRSRFFFMPVLWSTISNISCTAGAWHAQCLDKALLNGT